MDKDKFLSKIQAIGTCEDDAKRRTMLAELNEDANVVFAEMETLNTTNKQYKEENDLLQSENYKLFRRVGFNKTEEQRQEDTTGVKPEEKKEYKSYDTLIKEYQEKK